MWKNEDYIDVLFSNAFCDFDFTFFDFDALTYVYVKVKKTQTLHSTVPFVNSTHVINITSSKHSVVLALALRLRLNRIEI